MVLRGWTLPSGTRRGLRSAKKSTSARVNASRLLERRQVAAIRHDDLPRVRDRGRHLGRAIGRRQHVSLADDDERRARDRRRGPAASRRDS